MRIFCLGRQACHRWKAVLISFFLSAFSVVQAVDLSITHLRVNGLQNPVGIDDLSPAFSWIISSGTDRGVFQIAYEIMLFSDKDCQNAVWNSGKIVSGLSVDRLYDGVALMPSTRYYWKVNVWDNKGREKESEEIAYFETGLMNEGWSGAKWIKATDIPSGQQEIDHYTVETDFEVENLAAGIIFGAKDEQNYFMWQINFEAGYPRFRPHSWRNGQATCHEEKDLRQLIDVKLHQTYKLRIEVDRNMARTFIDGVLIDERVCPWGGEYGYGQVGIRQDRALYNYYDLEKAYFDNVIVKNLTGNVEEILVKETFDEGTENPFSAGELKGGRLFVEAQYAWHEMDRQYAVYDLTLDVKIGRDNAGIIFSAYDVQNFHMWSLNVRDGGSPILRRHLRVNGVFSSSDVSLDQYITKEQLKGTFCKVKISVRGQTVETYINDVLVDTYNDTSGRLQFGQIGFRAYYDNTMNEEAYYDNIVLTRYDMDPAGTLVFSENFENAGNVFSGGEIVMVDNNKVLKITSSYEESCVLQQQEKGMPMFRKEFSIGDGQIRRAFLYSSALGVYDVYVNGRRAGRMEDGNMVYDELKPGWTDYRFEAFYLAYDVTELLQKGANVIGACVSRGWWNGAISRGVYGNVSPGFIAKLRVEYEDGTVQNIVTDTDWQSSYCGPLIYGDIYDGEIYDARREGDWFEPGYDASGWYKVAENTDFKGKLVAWLGATVQIRKDMERCPNKVTVYEGIDDTGTTYGQIHVKREQDGETTLLLKVGETAIFDMGQNMVGWIRFNVKGAAGTQLKFRFGEMLNDTGDAGRADDGPGGSVYTYNLRTAKATLLYTLKGLSEGETYAPTSTFFGFRYCQLTATSDVEIAVTGEVVGSALEETAHFETDHEDVNQLYQNIIWGQRGNFLSIPTDCPQRDERLGWTGDTQIFARTANYNSDARAFYRKWMRDLRNGQRSDGAYPDMAPYCNFWGYGNAAWGDAGIIVPWTVYTMTGNTQILSENYLSMQSYMDFLEKQSGGGFLYNGAGVSFGDWLAYENMDTRYVSVCYYAYVADLMAKIAGALGDGYQADSLEYAKLHENIIEEYRKRYIGPDGLPVFSTQTAYLLPLSFKLLSEDSEKKVVAALRDKITKNGYKLSTGFVGTGLLNQTLSQYSMDDLAYNLLLQRDNPSWLYSVDQGATTIWERWDSYTIEGGFNKHPWIMNSFNHYAYGVIAEWLYRYVGGIEVDEANPGFKHFILQPTPDVRTFIPQGQKQINKASVTFRSVNGVIESGWQIKDDGRLDYRAVVPANTSATLYLPILDASDKVLESGKSLDECEGVTFRGIEGGKAVIELQSGCYEFNVQKGEPDRVDNTVSVNMQVLPNPFVDYLLVQTSDPVRAVSIFDVNGTVMCKRDNGGQVNTASWAPGIYIVNVATEQHNAVCKVLKCE